MTGEVDVARLIGRTPIGFCRVLYLFNGAVDESDGPLEICLGDQVALFQGGPDGETLLISNEPWLDPFVGELTPENAAYVQGHGKWTRIDVSDRLPYSQFIGRPLEEVRLLKNAWGKVAGVLFRTGASVLRFRVEGDECYVDTEGSLF